jgi:hypothetical protein
VWQPETTAKNGTTTNGRHVPRADEGSVLRQVLAREAEELAQRQRALAQARAALGQQLGVAPGGVVWQLDPATARTAPGAPGTGLAWHVAEIDRLHQAILERMRAVTEALWQEIARLQKAQGQQEKQHAEALEAAALARTWADAQCRELRTQIAALRQQLNEKISLHGGLPAPALPQSPGQPPAGNLPHAAPGESLVPLAALLGAIIGGGIGAVGAVLREPNAMIVAGFGIVLLGLAGALVGAGYGIAHRSIVAKIPALREAWRRRREKQPR